MAVAVREARELLREESGESNEAHRSVSITDGDYRVSSAELENNEGSYPGLLVEIKTDSHDSRWTKKREDELYALADEYDMDVYTAMVSTSFYGAFTSPDYIIRREGDEHHIEVHGSRLAGHIDMNPDFVEGFGNIWGAETEE